MLQLQKHLLLFRHSASPIYLSIHRALLSTNAASPSRFVAGDYLVHRCGLTREQAAKAAKYISHHKSFSNADAVLAYLAGPALGLSRAEIAFLVSRDARILNCSVERTIRPRVDDFRSHGCTAAQIRTFVRRAPSAFRAFNVNQKLGFWIPFLGSADKFFLVLRRNLYLATCDTDGIIKTNIQLLRDSGLSVRDIARLCLGSARLITSTPDRVRSILERADKFGIPRSSLMFKQAVATAAWIGPETMAAKFKFIGKMLGCSKDEVARAARMNPMLPRYSREKLQRTTDFLFKVVGVDAKYILDRPVILLYSLERRLLPRHYIIKVLKEKGLVRKDLSFYTVVTISDELFQSRYIHPHKDALPGLADAYASACKGKIPIEGVL